MNLAICKSIIMMYLLKPQRELNSDLRAFTILSLAAERMSQTECFLNLEGIVRERVTGERGLPLCFCTPPVLRVENGAKPDSRLHRSVIAPLGSVPYMLAGCPLL